MNHFLAHLVPKPPGATLAIPVAEDWEDYALAVEAILVALPVLRDDVVAPTVARTRAKEARARGEVRRSVPVAPLSESLLAPPPG